MLNNQRGYTLIEIIIVFVLICFLLGGIATCSGVASRGGYAATAIVKKGDVVYRPLVKLPDAGKIGGVCAGMAYKWGIEPWIPRTIFIVGAIVVGGGILAYICFAIFLDSAPTPDDYLARVNGAS
ncbi:MAG: PspC transcriptional regulator, toxin of PspCB toxin-antitoxin pair [Candidatus Falkowbacteria bacterium GW2011_GWC2_38_22]|uniref:PspC transcriptional regulator, toxin of PspCB toxin-antitoxin pair n=1 Tax=Candidatus Falkowbacteria bacterium GW2011_GWE1_38_31 TaxID=1618638 RepID=A0A0G0JP72_9BACT|nr:MAG: PspC transcriptional regulator, toxin of PspCB toxin-antitoxin pair [Candidatus Falkowbacteria bacterium GW2011_GWF2_38_1205]KKQ60407.1 MAG: PspC transcriptional regulator, toxin of PspCB toxin-antitoxin pair [Candidatus Falkowbacteria bacterium GW2011_GWC2_38_22]KKQ62454.1 MAG: PspC transcriptional regulator, toxin of PspCB toxin-antitoxin pair [Candidatus Falkowbacteria bacterium GW2011_GWF1_38_22]KKQ64525.1 MAG: PspC transcriptional regulator, toxin of PspCB toxin-antitoxin pair [Cand